jgi:hypothetical protein
VRPSLHTLPGRRHRWCTHQTGLVELGLEAFCRGGGDGGIEGGGCVGLPWSLRF